MFKKKNDKIIKKKDNSERIKTDTVEFSIILKIIL
jgi:hypothetical protein